MSVIEDWRAVGSISEYVGDGAAARGHLIAGEWVPAAGGGSITSIDPSNGEAVAEIAAGDGADVDRAVGAAREAFEAGWRTASPIERQDCLLRFADLLYENYDELALLDTLEMGAPVTIARNPLGAQALRWTVRFFAGLATTVHGVTQQFHRPGFGPDHSGHTLKEPIGVVAAITAWNSPRILAINKLAPALAAGCTVVLKPSEETSLSALRIGELAGEAGFPAGVVNVVTGTGAAVGQPLIEHPEVDKVSFTGSPRVGRAIVEAAAADFKRYTLELGGKSPNIVFADADIDLAVPGAAMAVFAQTGQACCAGSRLFVERPIYEEFLAKVVDYARRLRVGPGLDPETQIGPLISERQLDRVLGFVDAGVEDGGSIRTGGRRLTEDALADGYFVPPTVVSDLDPAAPTAREEIFGPVVCAFPFDSVEEAIELGNDSHYGLAAGVWTNDLGKVRQVTEGLRAGILWANTYNLTAPGLPWGGFKTSGVGREGGLNALDEYLEEKGVIVRG
ncbi:MAG: aldehyde dehydrogenase family protein [Solirubrobacterales bacterium]